MIKKFKLLSILFLLFCLDIYLVNRLFDLLNVSSDIAFGIGIFGFPLLGWFNMYVCVKVYNLYKGEKKDETK